MASILGQMGGRSRSRMLGILLLIGALNAVLPILGQADEPPGAGEVVIRVSGVPSSNGSVRGLLWRKEKGFPSETAEAFRQSQSAAMAGEVVLIFGDVPPGRYAVSVIHDVDDDGDLATNIVGMPQEGVGISNAALGFFGPEPFEKALVEVGAGGATFAIELRHW